MLIGIKYSPDEIINNTNTERNSTQTITDTNSKPTIGGANNSTNAEIFISVSGVLSTAIKDTNIEHTAD